MILNPSDEEMNQSALYDAAIICAEDHNDGDLRIYAFNMWHVRNRVPTYFGARILGDHYGIKITDVTYQHDFRPSPDGMTRQVVQYAYVKVSRSVYTYTSRSFHQEHGKIIAKGMAFRKAVQMILFDPPWWIARGEGWKQQL